MAAQHEPKATYGKFDDMLADPKVEAVIIGVADQFHVPSRVRPSRRANMCSLKNRSG